VHFSEKAVCLTLFYGAEYASPPPHNYEMAGFSGRVEKPNPYSTREIAGVFRGGE
jgi:hypothetical protein